MAVTLYFVKVVPMKNEQLMGWAKPGKNSPPGTGVPPTIFNNEHSKIGLKFGVCAPITITLGLRGVTPPNYTR